VGLGEAEGFSSITRGTTNVIQPEHSLEEFDGREGCKVDAEAFVEARAVEPAINPKVSVKLEFVRLWENMGLREYILLTHAKENGICTLTTYIKMSSPEVGLDQIPLLERYGFFSLIMICDYHVDIVVHDAPDLGILGVQTCEMEMHHDEDLHWNCIAM